MEDQIVTALFRSIAGKSRIIRYMFQRTCNGSILVKSNTGLKIVGSLAEQILIAGVRRYS